MTIAFNAGYEDGIDLTSFLTVRHSRTGYELTPRTTEIAGIDPRAYGGRHPATDSAAEVATKKNDTLKCSDCKEYRHFEQFPLSTIFLHRHSMLTTITRRGRRTTVLCGRGYQCNACKHRRYEEAKAAALSLAMYESQQAKQPRLSKKQKKQAKRGKLDKNVA